MALFQGGDNAYWFWIGVALTAAFSLAVWYFVIVGRDRPPVKQRRGEQTVEHYGTIEEDRAPMPRFLFWTFVGVGVWALVYAIWTGVNGIGAT